MATKKNRVTTFVHDETMKKIEEFMRQNQIWSHSKAVELLVEEALKQLQP